MVSKIKELLKSSSFRFTLFSAIGSAFNFLTLILFGRLFKVEEYAVISTFQAFVANIAVAVIPLQIIFCKSVAASNKQIKTNYITIASYFSFFEILLMIVLSNYLMKFVGLDSFIDYFLLILLVLINNLYLVAVGGVQGLQNFHILGIVNILLYLVKLILSFVFALNGFGVTSVLIGFLLADLVCLLILLQTGWSSWKSRIDSFKGIISFSFIEEWAWLFFLYLAVTLYMNNGDILLGNLYIQKYEMGLYSVVSNLSKISVFLISTPIATMLLPNVASCYGDKVKGKQLLYKAELLTILLSLGYEFIFCCIGKLIIKVLYGVEYIGALKYIISVSVFSCALSVFWVFYQYAIASSLLKSFTIIAVLCGLVSVLIISVIHPSMLVLPIILSVSMACSILFTIRFDRKNTV